MQLIDTETTIGANVDGLYLEHTQEIPSELLDTLKSERHARATIRAGDYDKVCEVPTFVIELWMRQGFDFYKASAREIVKRLGAHDLGVFITTPKRV